MPKPKATITIDPTRVPRHIAIIMDGNGRWATKRGSLRLFGHRSAIKAVRDTVEGAVELGVQYLTLYAFSAENWQRPKTEVMGLMELLLETLRSERDTLLKNGVRLRTIGDIQQLPEGVRNSLEQTMKDTVTGERMTLTLALSYGSRQDIINAVRKIAAAVQLGNLHTENIDEGALSRHLSTHDMPEPELLIRTSGEQRISNFLLWEIAYSEIHISAKLWPDFRRADLQAAILDYQQRERRFGKTSEQIKTK